MAVYQGSLATIRAAVIAKMRLEESLDSDRADEWINLAYIDVVQQTGCNQSTLALTLASPGVDGDGFTIPSDTGWITDLIVDDEVAQQVSLEEILRQRQSGSTAAGPLYALAGGSRVEVFPEIIVSTAITVWQGDLPDALSADGDEPAIPEPFASRLLESGALVEAARFKKDPLLPDYEAAFKSWLDQFTAWLKRRAPQGPVRLRFRGPHTSFGGIQTSVADKLGLDSLDGEHVKGWINQAYAEAVQSTGCLQQSGTAALTSGTSSYDLPSTVAWIKLLTVSYSDGTSSGPFRQVTLEEILQLRRATTLGAPPRYALVGQNQIELWPTPGTGETMVFWYVYLPTPLASDADVCAIMEPYGSELLESGALVKGARFKQHPLLPDFEAAHQAGLARFQVWLNRREGQSALSFRVRGAATPVVSFDRSADLGGPW